MLHHVPLCEFLPTASVVLSGLEFCVTALRTRFVMV